MISAWALQSAASGKGGGPCAPPPLVDGSGNAALYFTCRRPVSTSARPFPFCRGSFPTVLTLFNPTPPSFTKTPHSEVVGKTLNARCKAPDAKENRPSGRRTGTPHDKTDSAIFACAATDYGLHTCRCFWQARKPYPPATKCGFLTLRQTPTTFSTPRLARNQNWGYF